MNLNFSKDKWKEIETEILKTNWFQLINNLNINKETRFLHEELIRIYRKLAPYKLLYTRKNLISRNRRKLMHNRMKLTKHLKLQKDIELDQLTISWKRNFGNGTANSG